MLGMQLNVLTVSASLLLAIAAIFSAWLTAKHWGRKSLPGCGSGSGCHSAAQSRWARIGTIPVSLVGMVLYSASLALWLQTRAATHANLKSEFALLLTAWTIIAAALWFSFIQIFVLRRLCLYCTGIHLAAGAAAILIIPGVASDLELEPVLVATGLLVLMIVLQLLLPHREYVVQTTGLSPDLNVSKPPSPQPHTIARPTYQVLQPEDRSISLVSGDIVLRLNQWPVEGERLAPHLLGFCFDFTCTTCRDLHRLLRQARENYLGRLALVAIPIPQSPQCNPLVRNAGASHPLACAYARLGLAVWRAHPDRFETFANGLFEGQELPPLASAWPEANRLAETSLFDPKIADPDLDQVIQAAIAIHTQLGNPRVPLLLLPHSIVHGRVSTMDELESILQRHLNLTR